MSNGMISGWHLRSTRLPAFPLKRIDLPRVLPCSPLVALP